MSTPPQGGDNRPVRIPLANSLLNRGESSSVDGRLINAYAETVKNSFGSEETWIYKRPGLVAYSYVGAAQTGRGIFNWLGDIYSIWNGTFYKNNVAIGNISNAGLYTFSSALGSTPRLFFHNNTNAYLYSVADGLVAVNTTVANMVNGQAFLDGTTYVVGGNAIVQGSGINDLTSWPALNNLFAQIEPDQAVACAKQLVYVVVFKQWSTEMFYDAGNATGSPLGPVQGQKLNFGIRHAGTLAELSGSLLWVNQIREGGLSVILMDQLSATPISSEPVERLLQGADFSGSCYAWTAKIDGHMFYGVTVANSNFTLVLDLKQRVWSEWTDSNGNYFPIVSSTFTGQSTLVQHASNGRIYTLSTQASTDDGAIITSDIYTPPYDAGTRRRKTISRMRVVGDKARGDMLQIRTSDDDYQSWSNFRSVDMSTKDPSLLNCGTFRRRVWHIRQSMPIGGRILQALEPDIDVGES